MVKPLMLKVRIWILFFIVALILSGVTAFPLETELAFLLKYRDSMPGALAEWLQQCEQAISVTNRQYPMLAYGYDWLAFAHIVIAMAFLGPLKDPVKNSWVIDWAILACIAVLPLACIAGPIRQIPDFHIVIDCCFGLFGLIPLLICRRLIGKIRAASR
jgi:hypothetical protein